MESATITPLLEQRLKELKGALHYTDDLMHTVVQSSSQKSETILIFIEPLTDSVKIRDTVLIPLSSQTCKPLIQSLVGATVTAVHSVQQSVDLLLLGYCLICTEDEPSGVAVQVEATYARSVSEPQNEKVVRGSHEGLVEQLTINLNMIRRKVINAKLTVKYHMLGKKTNSKAAILFVDEIVNPELVHMLMERVKSIHTDDAFSPDFMEDLIEDNPWSLFPQILHTERPDRVAASLLEGRVALIMEGSATALIMPVTFISFYQSPDDYNARWMIGSFFRLIRVNSFFLAITLPAFYIAVISFHLEVLPNELVLPVQNSLRDIPFPPLIEALLMEITIELIREMGIRLPTPISQTIGIVGGLVIGESVVQAGIVSSPLIIVVALTAIASFVVPSNEMSMAVRMIRFPFMILASIFGLLGISFGITILFIHMCKLESLGTPYLSGLAPIGWKELKDSLIRFPQWAMNTRPSFLRTRRKRSQTSTRKWAKDDE